jgi:hypothetical protein
MEQEKTVARWRMWMDCRYEHDVQEHTVPVPARLPVVDLEMQGLRTGREHVLAELGRCLTQSLLARSG